MYDRVQRRIEAKLDAILEKLGVKAEEVKSDVEVRPPVAEKTEAEQAAIANAPATPAAVPQEEQPTVDPTTNAPVTPSAPDPVTNAPSTPAAVPPTDPNAPKTDKADKADETTKLIPPDVDPESTTPTTGTTSRK